MKKVKSLLLSICLCVAIFALASCGVNGLGDMPQTDALVKGNGGFSVVKGDYLYFVDSVVTSSSLEEGDNKQGKVKVAALYRTKLNNGELDVNDKGVLNSYELVVSKVVGTENVNLFIFDDYIYYGTPNMQKDRDGKLRNDLINFCRVKLDGTNNEILYTTEQYGTNACFNFVKIGKSVYLIVFDGENVYQIEIANFAKTPKKILENVSKVSMQNNYNYEYAEEYLPTGNENYIYYTRDLTENDFADTTNKGNAIGKISISNNEVKEERVDGVTTYEIKEVGSKYVYVYKTENGNKCLYAIKDFKNKSTDIKVTATSSYTNEYVMPNINGENLGVIVNFGDKTIWVKDGLNTETNSVLVGDGAYEIKFCDGTYAYYLDGQKMYRVNINDNSLDTELVFDESDMDTTYLDFGQEGFIYYFTTYTGDSGDSQKYLKRVDLNSKVESDDDEDLGYKTELVGVLNSKHIKTED